MVVLRKQKEYVELEQSIEVSPLPIAEIHESIMANSVVEQRAPIVSGLLPVNVPT